MSARKSPVGKPATCWAIVLDFGAADSYVWGWPAGVGIQQPGWGRLDDPATQPRVYASREAALVAMRWRRADALVRSALQSNPDALVRARIDAPVKGQLTSILERQPLPSGKEK